MVRKLNKDQIIWKKRRRKVVSKEGAKHLRRDEGIDKEDQKAPKRLD